jgi:hypothetical protein
MVRFFFTLKALFSPYIHYSESMEPPTVRQKPLGTPLCTFLFVVSKPGSVLSQLHFIRVGGLPIYGETLSLRVPRVFMRLK